MRRRKKKRKYEHFVLNWKICCIEDFYAAVEIFEDWAETGEYTGDNHKSPVGRSITPEQFANRMILRKAMLRHGFKPLDSEWWHFTLRNEPFPDTYFTFPVN